ncbi:MAG: hypothetical protein ACLRZZ_07085, partial [Enterocloster sp.]
KVKTTLPCENSTFYSMNISISPLLAAVSAGLIADGAADNYKGTEGGTAQARNPYNQPIP